MCVTHGTFHMKQRNPGRPRETPGDHGSLIGAVEAGEARIEGVAGRAAARQDPVDVGCSWATHILIYELYSNDLYDDYMMTM